MRAIITTALICIFASPLYAGPGSDTSLWLEWFKPANYQLRTAASYLRTENIDLAALALEELIAAKPPTGLPPALEKAAADAGSEATKALREIDKGDGPGARKRLLALRETLFRINSENNIEVFDDCIWALRKKGPPLWHYRNNPPDLSDRAQSTAVEKAASDYLGQLEACEALAPAAIKNDKEWSRVAVGAMESLRRIRSESLAERDTGQLIRFIRELRSFDNLLYFRYG